MNQCRTINFNFTPKGVDSKNIVRFNPSITHYKDNMYLMSYRAFISKTKLITSPQNPKDKGGPWQQGWESRFDGTGFAIVKFVKRKFKIILNMLSYLFSLSFF